MGHYSDMYEEEERREREERIKFNQKAIIDKVNKMGDYDLQMLNGLLLKWEDFIITKRFLDIKL